MATQCIVCGWFNERQEFLQLLEKYGCATVVNPNVTHVHPTLNPPENYDD